MSGIGQDPEETAAELDEHGEHAGADLMREMAAEIERLEAQRSALLREAAKPPEVLPCACYPNPAAHETACPQSTPTEG
ncbi:hypothetical protein QMK19_03420 [Streptomyces sp. H10-C2]|uniref:hypothetical protein n=1 Tax=unclassified Streptomyces TaxID=2593676 RepID=UPI0024B9B768|nr:MULTISPECIES: hypothetical protein [unclassified Streptomyces]MDJ0342236.1 hypothetical protein [Streptomyces sp. PH10-H1]MDJ0368750.1 hypothetical protein [Streptomyces sp. H10-C2]